MQENGTVYFRSSDQWGNSSEVATYTVSNIDKVKPTITKITPSTTAPAESVTVTGNTTISFRATDTAGNETIESY